jgi:hypothetical protein
MRRKQILIDEPTDRASSAWRLAPAARKARSCARRSSLLVSRDAEEGADPLDGLIGLVDDSDGPDDVAEEHDHYLYGAPKRGRE